MGKYRETFHLGVGESAGLLRTNWEMSPTYPLKDNLWSISEISGKSLVSFLADQSAILTSLCCGSSHFVASILSGGKLPAFFTTTSQFMATRLLCEPLVYSNVHLSLFFTFPFKIVK